jgi:hypothetical protein
MLAHQKIASGPGCVNSPAGFLWSAWQAANGGAPVRWRAGSQARAVSFRDQTLQRPCCLAAKKPRDPSDQSNYRGNSQGHPVGQEDGHNGDPSEPVRAGIGYSLSTLPSVPWCGLPGRDLPSARRWCARDRRGRTPRIWTVDRILSVTSGCACPPTRDCR